MEEFNEMVAPVAGRTGVVVDELNEVGAVVGGTETVIEELNMVGAAVG